MDHATMRDVEHAIFVSFPFMTPNLLRTANRSRRLARPRQIFYYLARECTPASLNQLGLYLGRDHTTVLLGARRIAEMMAADKVFAAEVERTRQIMIALRQRRIAALVRETIASDARA